MENNPVPTRPRRFAILINLAVIIAVAIVGVFIAYFSMAIFTKHGEETIVPGVENISYTRAVEKLHSEGFNVEIRDSVFRDDVRPGFVIEQFPRANSTVKPGRKIFLYINAVHPKEVVIDDDAHSGEPALKDWSLRQVKARLSELGFKNIRIITVMGPDDRVIKLLAKGHTIYKMQRVPVNLPITIEVSDGRLRAIQDSLYEADRLMEFNNGEWREYESGAGENNDFEESRNNEQEQEYYEEPDYFIINEEDGY